MFTFTTLGSEGAGIPFFLGVNIIFILSKPLSMLPNIFWPEFGCLKPNVCLVSGVPGVTVESNSLSIDSALKKKIYITVLIKQKIKNVKHAIIVCWFP